MQKEANEKKKEGKTREKPSLVSSRRFYNEYQRIDQWDLKSKGRKSMPKNQNQRREAEEKQERDGSM